MQTVSAQGVRARPTLEFRRRECQEPLAAPVGRLASEGHMKSHSDEAFPHIMLIFDARRCQLFEDSPARS